MRITKAQFAGLDQYKYSSIDQSFLSRRVLGPWWNWLVTLFPYNLAPNAVSCLLLACAARPQKRRMTDHHHVRS